MQSIGLISLGVFLVMGTVVGVRLLNLARSTRGAPEFCAGAGLLCLTVLAHPFSAAARLPVLLGTAMGDILFAVGMATTAAGVGLMYAFTWKVFRPTDAWARALVILAFVISGIQVAGLQLSTTGVTEIEKVLPLAMPWTVAVTLTLAGAFAWTGVEALLYYAKLRRRLSLGLADPVVTDRVRLWGLSGVANAVLVANVAFLATRGKMVLHDPSALVLTAMTGLATSVLWYLAFLPPPAYLAWVRRRATS